MVKLGSYTIKNGEVTEYQTKQEAEEAAINFVKKCLSHPFIDVQKTNMQISLVRYIGAGRDNSDISWSLITTVTS
jgi:hypothetical protein